MTKDNLYRMEDYDGFYDREEEEMYEEAVQRIERDIPAYMYTAPYDEFMHFIIQNHHELNRSYSEPCLAEIAYDKYVRLNKKHSKTLKHIVLPLIGLLKNIRYISMTGRDYMKLPLLSTMI